MIITWKISTSRICIHVLVMKCILTHMAGFLYSRLVGIILGMGRLIEGMG